MSFQWTFHGPDEAPMSSAELPQTQFPTQADAEAWFAQEWSSLTELGVSAVTLRNDDHVVYGPMSLDA